MGPLAPRLQLAVKVFKVSRFHTVVVCQLALEYKAVEIEWKQSEMRIKGVTQRDRGEGGVQFYKIHKGKKRYTEEETERADMSSGDRSVEDESIGSLKGFT